MIVSFVRITALSLQESRAYQYGLIIFFGVLGAQRLLLPSLYAYACLPIFLAAIMLKTSNKPLSLSLLIFSLFLSVDNGGEVYNITPGLVRYPIYLLTISELFGRSVDLKGLFLLAIFLLVPFSISMFDDYQLDWSTLVRDLFIVVLLFSFCTGRKVNFSLDLKLLVVGLTAFLLSELLNIGLIPKSMSSEYLSYNSTKALLTLPFFYFMVQKKKLLAILIFFITSVILVSFGTRMLLISFLIATIISLASSGFFSLKGLIIFVLIGSSIILIFNSLDFAPESLKATGVFVQLAGEGGWDEKLRIIDPARYTEHLLFFKRGLFNILFGSGLGSGLADPTNEFFFVSANDTAFSIEELTNRYFYNLHDTWIDLGLRFGLLSIVFYYLLIFRNFWSKVAVQRIFGPVLFVLFSCSTFSTPGLILIAFLTYEMLIASSDKEALHCLTS